MDHRRTRSGKVPSWRRALCHAHFDSSPSQATTPASSTTLAMQTSGWSKSKGSSTSATNCPCVLSSFRSSSSAHLGSHSLLIAGGDQRHRIRCPARHSTPGRAVSELRRGRVSRVVGFDGSRLSDLTISCRCPRLRDLDQLSQDEITECLCGLKVCKGRRRDI